jgi:hypothetical protein
MGGRGGPPDGLPEGTPGGDDEFRSVVFDESFIRAARIQELSAQERLSAAARPIEDRRSERTGVLPRQALALMLLIAMAFAAAVYMGVRHPYRETVNGGIELSMSVIPLQAGPGGVPTGRALPAGKGASATASPKASASASSSAAASASSSSASAQASPPTGSASSGNHSSTSADPSPSADDPFAGTAVEGFPIGEAGISLPSPADTSHFSADQVLRALTEVQTYLQDSSLEPTVLSGTGPNAGTDAVRELLDPNEVQQFDSSLANPRNDRRHEVTGWMVRFNPKQVLLASPEVRVTGRVHFSEAGADTLQVTSDHTFVYALRQARTTGPTVLFTVRRDLVYRFSHYDLAASRMEIADSVTQAGPMACDANPSAYLHPTFPSKRPSPSPGTSVDPFDHNAPAWQVCGTLSRATL